MTNTELINTLAKLGSQSDQVALLNLIKRHDNPVVWESVGQIIGTKEFDAVEAYRMAVDSASPLRQYVLWSSAS